VLFRSSPALENGQDAAVSVVQAPLSELLLLLAAHHVQIVLCDTPAPRGQAVRVHTHFLGASPILLYAACDIADKVREGFPDSLNGTPFLFPAAGSGLRSAMERWLAERGISVHTAGEIEGADLLRKFGLRGLGVFPIREALQGEVESMGGVQCIGEMKGVSEKYYAVSLERRMANPLLAAIIKSGNFSTVNCKTVPLQYLLTLSLFPVSAPIILSKGHQSSKSKTNGSVTSIGLDISDNAYNTATAMYADGFGFCMYLKYVHKDKNPRNVLKTSFLSAIQATDSTCNGCNAKRLAINALCHNAPVISKKMTSTSKVSAR